MTQILSDHTGRPAAQVLEDIDRDYFMSAEEAKAYGIVDEIVSAGTQEKKK